MGNWTESFLWDFLLYLSVGMVLLMACCVLILSRMRPRSESKPRSKVICPFCFQATMPVSTADEFTVVCLNPACRAVAASVQPHQCEPGPFDLNTDQETQELPESAESPKPTSPQQIHPLADDPDSPSQGKSRKTNH